MTADHLVVKVPNYVSDLEVALAELALTGELPYTEGLLQTASVALLHLLAGGTVEIDGQTYCLGIVEPTATGAS